MSFVTPIDLLEAVDPFGPAYGALLSVAKGEKDPDLEKVAITFLKRLGWSTKEIQKETIYLVPYNVTLRMKQTLSPSELETFRKQAHTFSLRDHCKIALSACNKGVFRQRV